MLNRAFVLAACLVLAGPVHAATGTTGGTGTTTDTGPTDTGPTDTGTTDTGTTDTGTADTGTGTGSTGTTDTGTGTGSTPSDSGTPSDSDSGIDEDSLGSAELAGEAGGFGCNNGSVELATGLALIALWLVIGRRRDGEGEAEPVRVKLRRKR